MNVIFNLTSKTKSKIDVGQEDEVRRRMEEECDNYKIPTLYDEYKEAWRPEHLA
jgi:hypothetical protein